MVILFAVVISVDVDTDCTDFHEFQNQIPFV
jgi:hypothetical protein